MTACLSVWVVADGGEGIWLVAPLDSGSVECMVTKDKKTKSEQISDPTACANAWWVLVQKLDDSWGATDLLNRYVSQLFSIIIKLWVLIAIWAVVVGWIMVSMAWWESPTNISWKDAIIWWVVAFILLILAWLILKAINPIFFV